MNISLRRSFVKIPPKVKRFIDACQQPNRQNPNRLMQPGPFDDILRSILIIDLVGPPRQIDWQPVLSYFAVDRSTNVITTFTDQ